MSHLPAHLRQSLRHLSIAIPLLLSAVPAAADSVVVTWNEEALRAIRQSHPGPTVVARAVAVVHTSVYEAWAAYDAAAVGTRLGGSLRRPEAERTEANKRRAVSFAAYRALADLFPQPAQVARFQQVMRELGYDPGDTSLDPATPTGIGNRAAAAVLEFRHADGSNQLGDLSPGAYSDYTGYAPVNPPDRVKDPNRWQALRVWDGDGGTVVQKCTTPHWGRVTPFALPSASQLRPGPPALFPSAAYRKQVKAVLRESARLDDRRKMIVEYWADGPSSEQPPGHWSLFAQHVSHRDGYGLDQDVKLFFVLGNAVMDAGIGCWETKLFYDYARPITAVRFLYKGKKVRAWGGPGRGTRKIRGEQWLPFGQSAEIISPPFPEYTSGHSTFSAAAAEVLRRFTGSDAFGFSTKFKRGSSFTEPGLTPRKPVTLRFPTFTAAAEQAGMSRVYGGIHFMDANVRGQQMGKKIGELVWHKAQTYFDGSAAAPPGR